MHSPKHYDWMDIGESPMETSERMENKIYYPSLSVKAEDLEGDVGDDVFLAVRGVVKSIRVMDENGGKEKEITVEIHEIGTPKGDMETDEEGKEENGDEGGSSAKKAKSPKNEADRELRRLTSKNVY